jgi:alkylation response protein AidB-like acyl-CoA dehydrogenase
LDRERSAGDQLELWDRTVAFAKGQLSTPDMRERDRDGVFWKEGWRRCGAFGVQGLPVPEELGGLGLSMEASMVVLDALGYACADAGLLFSICAHMFSAVIPIWLHGTPDQRERYLRPLATGEMIGCHAMTEPGSGSDAFALRTRARRDGDGYVLDGSKTFITNAPVADVLIIFARLDEPDDGLAGFLIERGHPGIQVGPPIEKMGLRTSPMAEVVLDGCRVGAQAVVGGLGAGASLFNSSMLWERACIMAPLVGGMQRQLERCVAYARERKQFGQPIGKFEAVSSLIADMKVRLETARALLYQVGREVGSGKGGLLEASVAKLYASEAAVAVHRDAIQIHGGYGYAVESEVERDLRDVLGSTIYSGTSEMQRYIIGRLLGL